MPERCQLAQQFAAVACEPGEPVLEEGAGDPAAAGREAAQSFTRSTQRTSLAPVLNVMTDTCVARWASAGWGDDPVAEYSRAEERALRHRLRQLPPPVPAELRVTRPKSDTQKGAPDRARQNSARQTRRNSWEPTPSPF